MPSDHGGQGDAIRIAMVHSFYSSAQPSGENTVVLNEVDALRRAGHTVELFAAHTDEPEGEVLYKLRAGLRVATGYGRNPLKAINDFGPDVVHIHNLFPNFSRQWVSSVDVPLVCTLHNYRPLCASGIFYRDGHVCFECIDAGPTRALIHKCYRGSRVATAPLVAAQMRGADRDPVLMRADGIVVLSTPMRDLYASQGISADKMVTWPNFLPAHLDPGHAVGTDRNGYLFVGRLTPEKGVLELVEAWPEGQRLTIIGAGEDEGRLRAHAVKNSWVKVLGRLTREEVLSVMLVSSALVFPSRWLEGFPLIYPESLACGLPVLATAPSSLADAVQRDGTGQTFKDVAQLASRIGIGLSLESTPETCRRRFEERYAEGAYIDRAEGLYEKLLGRAGGNRYGPL